MPRHHRSACHVPCQLGAIMPGSVGEIPEYKMSSSTVYVTAPLRTWFRGGSNYSQGEFFFHIYYHYAGLLWPPLRVATSPAIPSSVGSSIGWPPLLETDFDGSGFWPCFFSFPCFPFLLSGFYFGASPPNIYNGFRFPFPASPPFFLSLRRALTDS